MTSVRPLPVRSSVLAVLVFAACQGAAADRGPDPSPAAVDPRLAVAPLPYTAEQIREAHPSGTTMRFRVTQPNGTGVQSMQFSESDPIGVTVAMARVDASGATTGKAVTTRSTWRELQSHAAFPALQTRRERSRCVVPAGDYACWHYTVSETTADGRAVTSQYWFADRKPGPPVQLVRAVDGQEIYRMELVDYQRGR